ncbi:BTAD domain-containing putative transcriptional regulator [Kitasatospora griseola]|uniref:BTAD domain-containing putative transcriptional regulator n=1 Tax=Kitasatospora griseola TaxID=2064 RepID=UPI0037F9CBF9
MGGRTGWEFGVLGPLEVRYDGCVLTLGSTRQRAALTALAAAAGRTVPTAELIDAVWEEDVPPSALNSLQSHLSRLRSRLVAASGAPVLGHGPAGYRLLVTPERIDARRFERAAAGGREHLAAGRPDRALELLCEALGLWRGAALGEFRDHCSLRADSARLEELRLLTVESAAAAELALRRPDDAAARLTALVAEHPLRERALARLMLALYRTGRQADALALYRRSRRRLVAELGVEPGAELAGTQRAILRHDPALRPGPNREDRVPAVHREVERRAATLVRGEGPDAANVVGSAGPVCVAAERGIVAVAEESPRQTPADAPTPGSGQHPEAGRPEADVVGEGPLEQSADSPSTLAAQGGAVHREGGIRHQAEDAPLHRPGLHQREQMQDAGLPVGQGVLVQVDPLAAERVLRQAVAVAVAIAVADRPIATGRRPRVATGPRPGVPARPDLLQLGPGPADLQQADPVEQFAPGRRVVRGRGPQGRSGRWGPHSGRGDGSPDSVSGVRWATGPASPRDPATRRPCGQGS